jgi:biopolymer transport protein ExbD
MREEPRVEIDMTPMIDIVFQLLTFFMVVINFEAADADERVKMAVSDLARPPKAKPAETLVVQVGFNRVDGRIKNGPWVFYSGREIPLENFETEVLKREKAFFKLKNPDAKVVDTVVEIRADADCPAGKVQELIEMCHRQTYEKFTLKAVVKE